MNDKILEICALQSKMYDQMMKIDEAVLEATQMNEVVASVTKLVKDVQSFGYTDINVDRIKSCEALKEFCNVELCLKYKSVESLGEAAKEAFKKFCRVVVAIVNKLIVFFQDVFNTTSSKCKQIISNRSNIDLNKAVNVINNSDLKKMLSVTKECQACIDKYITDNAESVDMIYEDEVEKIAESSEGMIAYDRSTGSISFTPPERKSLTLDDAGFTINDITALASAFTEKSKSYNAFGHAILKLTHRVELMRIVEKDYVALKHYLQTVSTAYSMMAKAQTEVMRQLAAYWSCIKKDSDVTVPDDAEKVYVGNLPYDADENDIKSALQQYVTVYKVEIVRNQFNGNSKGYAYVYVNAGDRDTLKNGPEITIKGRTVKFN